MTDDEVQEERERYGFRRAQSTTQAVSACEQCNALVEDAYLYHHYYWHQELVEWRRDLLDTIERQAES